MSSELQDPIAQRSLGRDLLCWMDAQFDAWCIDHHSGAAELAHIGTPEGQHAEVQAAGRLNVHIGWRSRC